MNCPTNYSKIVNEAARNSLQQLKVASDEFELKFPKLSRSELKRFQVESSQAWAFQYQAETELTICIIISSKFQALVKNCNQISQFCMILIIFMIIHLNLCSTKVVLELNDMIQLHDLFIFKSKIGLQLRIKFRLVFGRFLISS